MTVDEMLKLARDREQFWGAGNASRKDHDLARAVIELLSAPPAQKPGYYLGVDTSHGVITISGTEHDLFADPVGARGLAVALLRAADEAEKKV